MMTSFASHVPMPQPVFSQPFGAPSFASHGAALPAPPYPHLAKPPQFLPFPQPPAPNAQWYAQQQQQQQQHMVPRDVLEQRRRMPCKHFEHHLGWCPYGVECHFLHDYSRLPSRGPSASSSPASSVASSIRSSPISFGAFYPPRPTAFQPAFAAPPPPRIPRILHHDFVPRAIGGTTYFPIRLDVARLGYVTPSGVEVFTDQ